MALCEPTRYISITDCRNTIIVTHESVAPPDEARIEKVDDTHYRVKSTGELLEYKERSETKGDNHESALKSFARLKAIINCNYETPSWCKFLTLTYKQNMQDNERIREDLQPFMRKLHRKYGDFEYIYVKEKQARGAWHVHMILFFDDVAPWMDNEDVRKLWGHGFVNVQGFRDDINNLGNYLCAYLTDGGRNSKKGVRLDNYESGIRLFNCSKGVKRPNKYRISYENYLDIASDENYVLLSEKETFIKCIGGNPIYLKREIFAVM